MRGGAYEIDHTLGEFIWERNVSGAAFVGRDGTWLRVNPRFCEILEYTSSELMSKTFQEITHPDDVTDDVSMAESCANGKVPFYIMSKRYLTKTGKVVWVKLRVDPIRDVEGKFLWFLSQVSVPDVLGGTINADKAEFHVRQSGLHLDLNSFVQKNWKWLLTGGVTIAATVLGLYDQWKELLEALKEAKP